MKYFFPDDKLLSLEQQKWAEGFSFVAGVDEAGRGPLAGPVVAAAVVFPGTARIPVVNDSKKLSGKRRNELREAILGVPDVQYAVVEVDVADIDRMNILAASLEAMRRALALLSRVDCALIDGNRLPRLEFHAESVIGGDAKSASIAAASILAKVHRDELMERYAEIYPGYGFEEHKGYGTRRHLEALKRSGVCAIHRRSFAPVRELLGQVSEQPELL